jgi:hypothetical protein
MYAALAHVLNIYENSNTTEVQPTFKHICQQAIDTVNHPLDELFIDDSDQQEAGCTRINNPVTEMRWLQAFKGTSTFPNPSVTQSGSKSLPTLLYNNPDLHRSFSQYVQANIKNLSTELIHQYLILTALPEKAKKTENATRKDKSYNVQNTPHDNGLHKLTMSTVHNWMKFMRFS